MGSMGVQDSGQRGGRSGEQGAFEDILLRRWELGTDYEVSFQIGFSYTFGSVFNNLVNPRMATGGGRGRWH